MRIFCARIFCPLFAVTLFFLCGGSSYASDSSSFLLGSMGLNTVPSARMDEVGTVRAGVSTLDPYIHGTLGFQLADPVHLTLRQSAEISNLNEDADRLYPGVDLNIRLLREAEYVPEISLGLQSVVGHKRMAGEYLALSKRYKDFDFTAGLGWGRYGSAGHIDNPLKAISSHFGGDRQLDGEIPNQPHDWFTGEEIGIFGGVEYFTPLKGLSVKLDYGADRYEAEKVAFDYHAPAPWSAGLSYTPPPAPWVNFMLGAQGTDKVMGRVSLSSNIRKWRNHMAQKDPPPLMRPYRTGLALPGQMERAADKDGVVLDKTTYTLYRADGELALSPSSPAPYQIGRAAVHMANHAGPAIEKLSLTPTILGLKGPKVTVMRRDIEQANIRQQGSPQEVWHHATFEPDTPVSFRKLVRTRKEPSGFQTLSFVLDNQLSLAEEDHGALYRTSLLAGMRSLKLFGFLDFGGSVRLNLKDNLGKLPSIRGRSFLPVRSDVDLFADRRLSVESNYLSFTHSFKPSLHVSLLGGYLEEMYGGVGGEVFYRPFDSRFSIGAETWLALKRDPGTSLNLGFNGDHLLTGHIKAWYDLPHHDLTLYGRAGRYLAEDFGGTIGVRKEFDNGAKLEGFVTVTDQSDFDLFGGTTHAYQGIKLSLPLGGFKYAPKNSEVRFSMAPFGRDIGQALENPLPLYEVTQPFSAAHMAQNWGYVVP